MQDRTSHCYSSNSKTRAIGRDISKSQSVEDKVRPRKESFSGCGTRTSLDRLQILKAMDLYTLRNSVCLLTVLCLCFTGRLDAQNPNLDNLDILEPIVRRSPAVDTDFFGFATVLHQLQPLVDTDDVNTAAGKTRWDPKGRWLGFVKYGDQYTPDSRVTLPPMVYLINHSIFVSLVIVNTASLKRVMRITKLHQKLV